MKKNNKTKIEISNRLAISIVACMTILFTISLGFAYGTYNPQVFGHSTGEVENNIERCVYSESNAGTATTTLSKTINLVVNGENICEWPDGCDIFLYTISESTGVITDASRGFGTFIQQPSGNYVSNVGQLDQGILGSGNSFGNLDSGSGPCRLSDNGGSSDHFGLYDEDTSNKCAVSICSRG